VAPPTLEILWLISVGQLVGIFMFMCVIFLLDRRRRYGFAGGEDDKSRHKRNRNQNLIRVEAQAKIHSIEDVCQTDFEPKKDREHENKCHPIDSFLAFLGQVKRQSQEIDYNRHPRQPRHESEHESESLKVVYSSLSGLGQGDKYERGIAQNENEASECHRTHEAYDNDGLFVVFANALAFRLLLVGLGHSSFRLADSSLTLCSARVLNQSQPLILALYRNFRFLGWGGAVQRLMGPYEVVVDLEALEDGRVSPFDSAHDLLSVSNLSVHSLHLVVVNRPIEPDFFDVLGVAVRGSELPLEGLVEVPPSVRSEDEGNLSRRFLGLAQEGPHIRVEFAVCYLLGNPEAGLVVHHGEQILHVSLDLDEQLVRSRARR